MSRPNLRVGDRSIRTALPEYHFSIHEYNTKQRYDEYLMTKLSLVLLGRGIGNRAN